ncbi:Glycogen operon protein GlgX [bacterium HR40]|nr:Glycogen operon protein GlgX [bacterium HR40]
MNLLPRTVWPGRPWPLGATFDGYGVNFALFSAHATKVELCLFDASGQNELARIPLPEYTDEVWHGYLPEARPGLVYGYRVHGPWAPERGHRFNPHKLLLDPYAREIRGTLRWHDALHDRDGDGRHPDPRDSAPFVPKAVVVDPAFTWGDDRRPDTPFSDTVIYEAHVRGFTRLHPEVPPLLRGTFLGLAEAPVIEHLLRLGVTAIELMPVQFFIDERHLVERGLVDYWGYNPLGWFAPEPRYLTPGGNMAEFKTMVRRLHAAGLEVILDVVYNHTAEGDHHGPTLSFRGIDNRSYYRLMVADPRRYEDPTGCGNALDLAHPRVLQLVMDSLRYWALEMRVDGFRFDLATTLGREGHGFDPGAAFFDAIRQDPVLSRLKLIAEPWDLGPDGYRLGGYGPGWAEWNDRFRDTVRAFWRGDAGMLPALGARLLGSADLFQHQGRRPWASINFVTAHDGFTLHDLVTYARKHNEANGEENRDGSDHNFSCNYGVEGPSEDPRVDAIRRRQMRNLLATLLLAQGTPMLLMGDEFARTQQGNNNAYCQDNEISWLDWSRAALYPELAAFLARLLALRRAHPVLRRPRFLHGRERSPEGLADVTWIAPDGREMTPAEWHEPDRRCLGLMLCGTAGDYRGPRGEPLLDSTLLLLLNAAADPVDFHLPLAVSGSWRRLLDTTDPLAGRDDGPAADPFPLPGRSLVLLERLPPEGEP